MDDVQGDILGPPHGTTTSCSNTGRLLKEAADELSPGLAHLFQISMDYGKIPLDWKAALVTPVFKKGNRSTSSKNRPISLSSIVCTVLEHVIYTSDISHFERNPYRLNKLQVGAKVADVLQCRQVRGYPHHQQEETLLFRLFYP